MSITSFEALITDPKELYNGQLQTLNECHREKNADQIWNTIFLVLLSKQIWIQTHLVNLRNIMTVQKYAKHSNFYVKNSHINLTLICRRQTHFKLKKSLSTSNILYKQTDRLLGRKTDERTDRQTCFIRFKRIINVTPYIKIKQGSSPWLQP